jgi:hypothetical protein
MSKIALSGNAAGTGTLTIAAPNTNTNRTLSLPDEAGTMLTNASNIEAQVKTATNATGSAPIYACRAWVNFDGTASPPSIRASGNVSSITDHGTGSYTVNFTTAMADVNYSTVVTSSNGNSGQTWLLSDAGPNLNSGAYSTTHTTTSSIRLLGGNSSNSLPYDAAVVAVAIFR